MVRCILAAKYRWVVIEYVLAFVTHEIPPTTALLLTDVAVVARSNVWHPGGQTKWVTISLKIHYGGDPTRISRIGRGGPPQREVLEAVGKVSLGLSVWGSPQYEIGGIIEWH